MKNHKLHIAVIITLALALVSPVRVKAQHLEIGPFAGYETGGKVYTNLGYLRVSDGMNFGGTISFGLDEDAQFEFSYNHMNGTLSLDNGEHIINSYTRERGLLYVRTCWCTAAWRKVPAILRRIPGLGSLWHTG